MIGCLFCLQVDGPILSCGVAYKWGLGLIIGCMFLFTGRWTNILRGAYKLGWGWGWGWGL